MAKDKPLTAAQRGDAYRREQAEVVEDPSAVFARDDLHQDFGDPSHRNNVLEDDPLPQEESPVHPASVEQPDDLHSLTVADLKELAEQRGVQLESGMRKDEIIEALEG